MRFALVLASFALAACGSTAGPGAQPSGAGHGSDVVCHEERSTGSTIPREVCRSKMQSDADRKGAEDMMITPRPAPASPGN